MKKIKLLVSLPLLALTCNYANATNNVQKTDFEISSAETSSPPDFVTQKIRIL